MRAKRAAGAGVVLVALVVGAAGASGTVDPPIMSGNPHPFPRGAQNELAIAVDQNSAAPVLAVGANDYQDQLKCFASSCTFTPRVGISGISFSLDGGKAWTRPAGAPQYTGWSGRSGSLRRGNIATVPRFDERRLASHGDPALAFGPRYMIGQVRFSWDAGSRLYYASLGWPFYKPQPAATRPPVQRITVSWTDDAEAAASGGNSAWGPPVVLSGRTSGDLVADKPAVWADNAESSGDFFGRVYVCWSSFASWNQEKKARPPGGSPRPILFTASEDGGGTWWKPMPLPPPPTAGKRSQRQSCAIRTDSTGGVYVFWQEFLDGRSQHVMTRSTDGGRNFEPARVVAEVVDVGRLDPYQNSLVFDGVAGARTNSWPSVDIANGAPDGPGEDVIVLAWADGRRGLNREQALVQQSRDRGLTWSEPVNVAAPGERPDFPAVAVSPDGRILYVVYTAFGPWQATIANRRPMWGVMRATRFAELEARGAAAGWAKEVRGKVGDARASSNSSLTAEFIGDYNTVVATDQAGYAVWVDASTARNCRAIDGYRALLPRSRKPLGRPPPLPRRTRCLPGFGNTGGYGAVIRASEVPGGRVR